MGKLHRDVVIRMYKLGNVLEITAVFGVYWYYNCFGKIHMAGDISKELLLIALFGILYCTFSRVYEAFQISIKRISEIIYSQVLAFLAADAIMFLISILFMDALPLIIPAVICVAIQGLMSILWAVSAHKMYFGMFPPRETVIVYDIRKDIDALINEYGMTKKYHIRCKMHVSDCLQDISVLNGVQTVFISGVHSRERNIILKYCVAHGIEVMVLPRIGDVLMSAAKPMHLFHLPILQVGRCSPVPEYLFTKRIMDIVISVLALLLLSPVMLIVAVCIKTYDGGPVLYSQMRLTKDGKLFRIYKFRSMRIDSEADGRARLSTGENDERITPIGKTIRKLRLDELPQFFNILRGELSVVGPRPERPEIAEEYMKTFPEFALRLQVKAGLTGYAQVYGKYNTPPYEKLQMDLMYIARPSIVEDLKIIMATVKVLFMPDSTDGVAEGQITAEQKSAAQM